MCKKGFGVGDLTVLFDHIQMLLQKVAQLDEALTQKDKFIHSSRMIVKFREDHISRLEKKLKEGQCLMTSSDSQMVIEQLKEEIRILRDQVQFVVCLFSHTIYYTVLFFLNFMLYQFHHFINTVSIFLG